MALLILYGLLACGALWATWRDADLRQLGIAIALNFVASNAVWLSVPPAQRPGPYTVLEMLVMIAAFMAFDLRAARHGRRSLALIAVIAAALLSACANVALALAGSHPSWAQVHSHELVTNACFAAECLLCSGVGIADGVRTGRFADRRAPRRRAAQPLARRDEGE